MLLNYFVGNIKRTDNPTYYRRPGIYCSMLHSVSAKQGGVDCGFELMFSKSVRTYVEVCVTKFFCLLLNVFVPSSCTFHNNVVDLLETYLCIYWACNVSKESIKFNK